MLQRDDLDGVIIATPWCWHTPMAVEAMKHGIVTGVEVPAALSLKECWELVNTSETTGVRCMMLENWSFRGDNLALLNMVRQGLFGRIVHVHCAHSHDCIDHWFFDKVTGADKWPANYLLQYNRDQYPTHSVGPVLSWCDINCGDRFTTLTSVATGSFGINDMFEHRFGPNHPGARRTYAQGDIVTSTLKTARGKTVVINYDMQLPRPYDNRWMLQGTHGIYSEERNSIYLHGRSPADQEWESFPPYQAKFSHRWCTDGDSGAHGGADRIMLRQFLQAIRDKQPLPLTIYDSVTMSAIVDLSGRAIAKGGGLVNFPDFTRGKWKEPTQKFAL
jgi:predicted dehydrogenase